MDAFRTGKELDISHFVFQLSPIGILMLSQEGDFLQVNSFFLNIFNLSSEEATALNINDILFKNTGITRNFEICLQNKEPIFSEINFWLQDKEVFLDLLFIPLLENPDKTIIQCILIDLTRKKEIEKEIKNIYSYFSKLLSGLSPVATVRADYSIKFVNEPFKKEILGHDEDVSNQNIVDLLPLKPKDKKDFLKNLHKSLKTRVHNCEFDIHGKIFGYSIFRFDSDIGIILKNITETRGLEKKIEELYSELMRLQERERQNIARDLHDSVGQTILAAKLNLSAYWHDPQKSEIKFQNALDLIDKTSQELRDIYTNLYPNVLKELGLESAIRSLLRGMFSEGYKIDFEYNLKQELSYEQELGIYRIFQEISSNIAKHSKADHIKIKLGNDRKKFFLEVIDNGRGFDLTKIQSHKGFGLNNMKIRVEDMGGVFQINSSVGKGTSITMKVPLIL